MLKVPQHQELLPNVKLRNLLLSITLLIMNRQVNGKTVCFTYYVVIFVAMYKILQWIKFCKILKIQKKGYKQALRTWRVDLDNVMVLRRKKISPPSEISYFDVLRQSEKFKLYNKTT